jgi:molybdopterin-containing oxidoreductase family iron-sulfur binding subunit
MEKKSRRAFLKESAATALGLTCGAPILATACGGDPEDVVLHGDDPLESQWAMVIDLEKTKTPAVRRACMEACHRVHNVPQIDDPEEEIRWIWEEAYRDVFPDQTHVHQPEELMEAPVLVLCNHCANPPCVRVCPTQATWKRDEDGLVMMDMHRCIGCRYCMAACPYGSRSFNWRDPRQFVETDADGNFPSEYPTRSRGVVEKCNFCAERLRDNLPPACVEAANQVPGGEGALIFGNLADANAEINQVLESEHTISRRVGLGTGPHVFYIV